MDFTFTRKNGDEVENLSPKFPAFLDASALSLYKSCPRKFLYQVLLQQRPRGRNTHLHAGSVYARAHDTARRHIYSGGSVEEGVALGARTLIEEYGDFEPNSSRPSEAAKTWDRVLASFIQYYEVFNPRDDVFIPVATPDAPGVEYSFAVPLPIRHPETHEPLLYSGRFDGLVHMAPHGWPGRYTDEILSSPIYGLDDKTTYQMGPTWASQWVHRSQFLGYTWAQRKLGVDVRGFVVRGAAIQKTQLKHEQCVLLHPRWKIDAWFETTMRVINDIITSWRYGHFHQMFDDACSSYGGCPYTPLCDTPNPQSRIHEYETVVWNPVLEDD